MAQKKLGLSDLPSHLLEYWLKHGGLPPTQIITVADNPALLERNIVKIEVWDYGPNFETDPEVVKHFKRTITIHEYYPNGNFDSIHAIITPSTASTAPPDSETTG